MNDDIIGFIDDEDEEIGGTFCDAPNVNEIASFSFETSLPVNTLISFITSLNASSFFILLFCSFSANERIVFLSTLVFFSTFLKKLSLNFKNKTPY